MLSQFAYLNWKKRRLHPLFANGTVYPGSMQLLLKQFSQGGVTNMYKAWAGDWRAEIMLNDWRLDCRKDSLLKLPILNFLQSFFLKMGLEWTSRYIQEIKLSLSVEQEN